MAKSKKINKLDTTEIEEAFEDKALLADFKTYMQDGAFKPEVAKGVDTSEVAKHGGLLSNIASYLMRDIGYYNPDNITIATYDKMRFNPQLQCGLKVIKLPIIGQQWTTVCDDSDIAEFIDQLLRPLWYNLLTSLLTGVDYGFSANEIVYKYDDIELVRNYEDIPFFKGRAVVWDKFKSLYPESVRIQLDEKENFAGITQFWVGKDIKIPLEKSFIFTHDKGDCFGNLFGISRMKPCYDTWYFWISLMTFSMRYFERKGTPPVIVKFPPGQTRNGTDNADIALEIGKSLLSESVVALSSKTYENTPAQWSIEYLTDDKRGEMFISMLTFLENKMLRGLFVPERTVTQDSTSKAGSYSLSKTHADMFLLGEDALLVDIENQINKYVVRRLVEYNFGKKAPQCYVKIERITDARKSFLKEVFMQMLKNGNAIPAAREIADTVGVPLEDENTQPTQSAQPKKPDNVGKVTTTKPSNPHSPVDNANNTSGTVDQNSKQFSESVKNDIKNKMDELENRYTQAVVDIWTKQRSAVLAEIDNVLANKVSIEDMWYVKIANKVGSEDVVLWQPQRNKMLDTVYSFIKESYLYGMETAVNELKSSDKIVFSKDIQSFVDNRSRMIVDNYFGKMKYNTELAVLSANSDNKTSIDIVNDIKKSFDTIKDRDIVNMITTEGMLALNKGRANIAKAHI